MAKPKNYYIKYKLVELENYIKNKESCVKKINCVERLSFAPNITGNFKESIMRILSRKIGKYDIKMQGVVLDFRNTKVLNILSDIRNDSAYSIVNVESNFYIFAPRKDAIVDGIVKHINHQSIETIITVVIYRVFNVKVTFKGCIKKNQVKDNDVIRLRIKQFHFDHEIPYIEGDMISCLSSHTESTRKVFEDVIDSGISESSVTFEQNGGDSKHNVRIKFERDSSSEPTTSTVAAKQTSSKRKRAPSPESPRQQRQQQQQPALKRIKSEPLSSEDDSNRHERLSDTGSSAIAASATQKQKTSSSSRSKTIKAEEPSQSESNSEERTKKKKDKKKKKYRSIEDEFESSLQLLFDTSIIKTESD